MLATIDDPARWARQVALGMVLSASWALAADEGPESPRRASVGMPARIDQIVLPGGQLEAKPVDSREVPVVLRVVATYPHGTAFRYDLEYYGLEPGTYDLGDYLQRKDQTPLGDLPPLQVEIVSLLPSGQILPSNPPPHPAPRLGGYRLWLTFGALLWLAGLATILLARRRSRRAAEQSADKPQSLAERLQPLVAAAVEGRLTGDQSAEIERLLISYWRHRLNLDELDPREAVAALRDHPQAGELLRAVEAWLHKPQGAGEVNLAALLAPYRDLPADEPSQASPQLAMHPAGVRGAS